MSKSDPVELARQRLMSEFWENRTGAEPPNELRIQSEDLLMYSMWFDIEGFIYETNFWTENGQLVYKLKEDD